VPARSASPWRAALRRDAYRRRHGRPPVSRRGGAECRSCRELALIWRQRPVLAPPESALTCALMGMTRSPHRAKMQSEFSRGKKRNGEKRTLPEGCGEAPAVDG